jgi:putative transposase
MFRKPDRMPRGPRIEAPEAIQHVIARAIAEGTLVEDDVDRRDFLTRLGRVCDRFAWALHAYCLMDTHVHLVLETPERSLSSGMRQLTGGYAFDFNRRHGRYGHLFAGRFKSIPIKQEGHAVELAAYVVLNPVRAGLVVKPEDWPWSSYRVAAGLVTGPRFLETRLVPGMLHANRTRAQAMYRSLVAEAAERPRPGSG